MKITHKVKIWQVFITIYATIIAVYIPVNVVLIPATHDFFELIEWLTTIIFIADIFINYYNPSSEVLLHREIKKARARYLKTWFIPDLIAAIPFALIMYNPVLGLLRVFKITSVARLTHILRQKAVQFGDYLLLTFFVYWLLIIAHWLACWWVYLRGVDHNLNAFTNYVNSLFWVIETLTTVGYGETVLATNAQKFFAMLVMLAGVGVYGFIIGNVANLLSKRNPARAQFFNNLDQLKVFVNYRRIPPSLQKKISDYYTYIWKKKLGFDESVFLSSLPQGLQSEVSIHLKREILEKIPLFQGVSDNFLREVSLHLRPLVCVPDENVFTEGEIGNEMYFIIRGKLQVLLNNKLVYTLTDGDFFGEIALFTDQKRRTATVKSISYSDLYRLDRELFDEVLRRYPKIADHIKVIAEKRMMENKNNQIG